MASVVLLILKVLWESLKATYRYMIPKSTKSVRGEVVLITGAGQGIGREIALIYASEGATVVCVDLNENTNRETVQLIADLGGKRAYAYTCDVSSYPNVLKLSQHVEKEVGNVTILINNAGIAIVNDICKLSAADIEKTIDVNLMSHFWTVKAILPLMLKKNYGHIVAVGSLCVFASVGYLTPYSASKYAIQGFMHGIQNELALRENCKIKTTTVHPCLIDTALTRNANIKYSSFPIYTAKETAQVIVDCQRRDVIEAIVPVRYNLTLSPFARLLPAGAVRLICEYFQFRLPSDQ